MFERDKYDEFPSKPKFVIREGFQSCFGEQSCQICFLITSRVFHLALLTGMYGVNLESCFKCFPVSFSWTFPFRFMSFKSVRFCEELFGPCRVFSVQKKLVFYLSSY